MKLTISIDDEVQLKKEIKDMVDGFIRQYAREEAHTILLDELKRIVSDKIKNFDETRAAQYITNILSSKLKETLGGSYYSADLVRKEALEITKKIAEDQLRTFDFKKAAFVALDAITGTVKTEVINNFKKLLDK